MTQQDELRAAEAEAEAKDTEERQAAPPPGWYPDAQAGDERWWDGRGWSNYHRPLGQGQVVVVQGKQVNHAFHLMMTVLTLGLWLPIWVIVAVVS